MELTGQTALITGGTAGIGLACARLMASEGAIVFITGRDVSRGESAAGIHERVRFIRATCRIWNRSNLLCDRYRRSTSW